MMDSGTRCAGSRSTPTALFRATVCRGPRCSMPCSRHADEQVDGQAGVAAVLTGGISLLRGRPPETSA